MKLDWLHAVLGLLALASPLVAVRLLKRRTETVFSDPPTEQRTAMIEAVVEGVVKSDNVPTKDAVLEAAVLGVVKSNRRVTRDVILSSVIQGVEKADDGKTKDLIVDASMSTGIGYELDKIVQAVVTGKGAQ